MTRYFSASSLTCGFQKSAEQVQPWLKTIGGASGRPVGPHVQFGAVGADDGDDLGFDARGREQFGLGLGAAADGPGPAGSGRDGDTRQRTEPRDSQQRPQLPVRLPCSHFHSPCF